MYARLQNRVIVSVTALILLCVASATVAEVPDVDGLDSEAARLTGERPNAGGAPTLVTLGMFLFDVDSIDDTAQQFTIDMFSMVSWNDPRLALPESERRGLIRTVTPDSIWTPKGLIINDRGLKRNLEPAARIDDLGNVKVRQRLMGPLAADFEFKEFPFDSQFLPIDVMSYANSVDELRFEIDYERSGYDGDFSIQGWELVPLDSQITELAQPGLEQALPRATFVIGARRDSGYYILTMFIPMTLIILMAWSVFWIPPDVIPARLSISSAAIFSFVAFGFTVRAKLPEVSYLTRADVFVTGCTLLVFIALGVAVAGCRLAKEERMEEALRVSAVTRWLYLLLFLAVVVATVVY